MVWPANTITGVAATTMDQKKKKNRRGPEKNKGKAP
jgi:hypothetical protein